MTPPDEPVLPDESVVLGEPVLSDGVPDDVEARPDAGLWVDRSASEPLHVQVRRRLETLVLAGTWPPPRPIPSSRYLATTLGVSRGTILSACQELVATGVLVSHPRSGLVAAIGPRTERGQGSRMPGADGGASASRGVGVPPGAVGPGAARPGAEHPESMPSSPQATSPHTTTPHTTSPHAPAWDDLLLPLPADDDGILEPDYADFAYPFLPGQIDVRTFPSRAWLQALDAALDGPHRVASLRDAGDRDDEELVDVLRTQILPTRGIHARPEEILVTAGTQQALSCATSALLDGGRRVALENPGYPDVRRLARATGATCVPLPVDGSGIVLPRGLECDVFFVTPGHQHPTNVTMSAARRRQLLEQARRLDAVVIEDDYDSEMRFRGPSVKPLKAQDDDGRVLYVGGFAKAFAPGLRLGYAVGPEPLIAQMRRRRAMTTKHPPGHLQRALALFIRSGAYHRVLRTHRAEHERTWRVLGDALERHLPWPPGPRPSGGFAYWLKGPPRLDASLLARRLRARSVLVTPGEVFFADERAPRHHLRVGFNAIRERDIEPGVRIIAEESARLLS